MSLINLNEQSQSATSTISNMSTPGASPQIINSPNSLSISVSPSKVSSKQNQTKLKNGKFPKVTKNNTGYQPTKRKLSYLFDGSNNVNGKHGSHHGSQQHHKLSIDNHKMNNRHRRKSSIQVNVLGNDKGRLDALSKELIFLKNEIPLFKDIYAGSEIQFKNSKGSKVETMQFIMIQALSSWITSYGKPSYIEYNEFKNDAEYEIINLVNNLNTLKNENKKLNIVVSSLNNENNELKQDINNKVNAIFKLENDIKILNETNETNELNNIELNELSNEITKLQNDNNNLTEHNDRLTSYLETSQTANDDLSNKNYRLEDEIMKLKKDNANLIRELKLNKNKHDNEINNLKQQYKQYEYEMQLEQQKLLQQLQDNEEYVNQENNGENLYSIDQNDDDIPSTNIEENNESYDHTTVINSLANEFEEYEYEDEDAWLNHSGSEYEYDDQNDDQNEWASETINMSMDFDNKEDGFEMVKQNMSVDVVDESKDFVSQKMDLSYGQLSSSQTKLAATPIPASPIEFETERTALSQNVTENQVDKSLEFSSSKMKMQQKNELVKKKDKPIFKNMVPPKQLPGKGKQKSVFRGTGAFNDILNKWKTDEAKKGGKPQIKFAKEYVIRNRWVTSEAQLQKQVESAKNRKTVKSTDPKSKLQQPKLNMHRKMTIIKKSKRFLKPRMMGYLQLIKSKYVKDYQAHSWQKEAPKFFFVLDALPSRTNTNANEPDFVKKKFIDDYLVPALFFFKNKNVWDQFYNTYKQTPVRELQFQKSFSKTAKGVLPLHNYYADETQKIALQKFSEYKGKKFQLPKDQKDGYTNDKCLFVVGQWESHRMKAKNKDDRDLWLNKIHKMVSKRQQIGRKGSGKPFETPTGDDNVDSTFDNAVRVRSSTVAKKLSVVKNVEQIFD